MVDGRKKHGEKLRKENNKNNKKELDLLRVRVHDLTKEKRRLKRKQSNIQEELAKIRASTDLSENESADNTLLATPQTDGNSSTSSALLEVTSPKSRMKIFRRLQHQSNYDAIKKQLRKEGHRVNIRETLYEKDETSTIRNQLRIEVETFMYRDDNSITCPDKSKTNLRYRLDFRHVLHEKFLTEIGKECSLSQFCRLIPCNIVKPEPQDWGTCLCMTCLNPQLKLEGLKRSIKEEYKGLLIEDMMNFSKEDMQHLQQSLEKRDLYVSYLQWAKVSVAKEKIWLITSLCK